MNRGMVIINTLTIERKLFLNKEDEIEYIKSIAPNFTNCPFHKMTNTERLEVLEFNYNAMKEFEDSISGNGRTYDNSIKLSFEEFKWIMEELRKTTKEI